MTGPLQGLKVLELASLGPGPLACTLLADLGADVLRIVRPGEDPRGLEGLGQGRPHLELDLRSATGVEQFLSLAATAQVIVEGGRPGNAEKLGVGPEKCLNRNNAIVYVRVTGWGQDGPRAREAGHDINYIAVTGALHAIGTRDTPVAPLNLVGDYAGGAMFAVIGALAALRSGVGQVVDAAMVDGVSYLLSQQHDMLRQGSWVDQREANPLDNGLPWYTTYECADGGHVAVGCLEERFFVDLCSRLDLHDAPTQSEVDRHPELRKLLADAFLRRTRDEWAAHFAGTDACVTPVLGLTEAARDPQLAHRRTLLPAVGGSRPAPAPRFSATPAAASYDRVDEQRRAWSLT